MCRSKGNLGEWVPSFHYVCLEDQTQDGQTWQEVHLPTEPPHVLTFNGDRGVRKREIRRQPREDPVVFWEPCVKEGRAFTCLYSYRTVGMAYFRLLARQHASYQPNQANSMCEKIQCAFCNANGIFHCFKNHFVYLLFFFAAPGIQYGASYMLSKLF